MLKSKSLLHGIVLVVIASLLLNLSSAKAAGSLSTAFTYQGVLKDGSDTPITNTCDFHFGLFAAASGGSLVAGTSLLSLPNVMVNNGTFTVSLDFGPSAFDGNARWLEIAVKCGSDPSFTTLTPRQPLTATPYALFSVKAETALNFSAPLAGDVTGNQGSTTVTKLQGQPVSASTPSAGQVLTFSGGNWAPVTPIPQGTNYAGMLVVAKSGGDFTSLTAALNSITNNSSSNMYLIQVAPGTYSEQVTMKPYVDIQGSGELNTKITWTGSSTDSTGTVIGADNAELRFLSVENTGGGVYAIAIYNTVSLLRLTHVTASASLATDVFSVYNFNSSPTMTNVSASASDGRDYAIGVYNFYSSPTMMNVSASASGNAITNYGVGNDHSSPVMTEVTATASGGPGSTNSGVGNIHASPTMTNITANAYGGSTNQGVSNSNSRPYMVNVYARGLGGAGSSNYGVYNFVSSAIMTNVTAFATGGNTAYGVLNDDSSAYIQNSNITATNSSIDDGIHNDSTAGGAGSPFIVNIYNSLISGDSSTIWTNVATYTIRVGASQLSRTGGNGIGTYICVFSYKADFTPLSSTCQ